MSTYNAAKYDAMAEELVGPNFKRLEPFFRKNNYFAFTSSRIYAICCEEGCNEEGWRQVASVKKGTEIRCPRHCIRGGAGHPVSREARDAKCLEALAPLGLQGLQMVPQTPAPTSWHSEKYSYICPSSGCSNRIAPRDVGTILKHGTADPIFCIFCSFKQQNHYVATLLDWGYEGGVITDLRTRTDPNTGQVKVCHHTSRAQVLCQGNGENGERCGQLVERSLGSLREAARRRDVQSIRCASCKTARPLLQHNYVAILLDWGYEGGVITDLRTKTNPNTGQVKVCHHTSRAQVLCQGNGENGERCGQLVERSLGSLRAAARRRDVQLIRCASCKYLTVTIHHYEFVVMNGYEGRSVRIAISDRCMPVGVVHTTHKVWVEIAPKGGILLECGSVACVRGAKRLVDLLVATKLPHGLRTNGNDSVVLNQENYAEWKERLGLGKTLDGLQRPLDAVETKGESTITIAPYLIETMRAFKALGLVYEVWCYRSGSDKPSIYSTEKELEAGIDRCRRKFHHLVHAPKRFIDVEEAKTFFEAQAARRLTKRSAKRSVDGEDKGELTEEGIMELEEEMHRGAFADL